MITIDNVDDAIANAEHAQTKAKDIAKAYAEQECPLKVGDVADCAGYAYHGKKMQVESIDAPKLRFHGVWEVVGTVINKDGTPGNNRCKFSQKNWEELKRKESEQ